MNAKPGTVEASQAETKRLARQAGALYVFFAILSILNEFFVPTFIVSGDPTATARNIIAGELVYRLNIAGSFAIHICFIVLVVYLYILFQNVDKKLAILMVLMVSLGVSLSLANLLNRIAPLVLLGGGDYLSVFTKPQLDALSLSLLRLHTNGVYLASTFWGLWLFPFGMLVIESKFIPRIFGILLILAGVGYLTVSITSIILPAFRPIVSPVMTPLYFGELPIIFWLAIKGIRVQKMVGLATAG